MERAEATQVSESPRTGRFEEGYTEGGYPQGSDSRLQVGSHAVAASMRQHGIPLTPDNYTVWHSYLAGSNANLKRAIDIILSNGLSIEENTLRVLFTRHFCQASETVTSRELAQRMSRALATMQTQSPAACPHVLLQLGKNLQDMVQQSERLTSLLSQSTERVAQLERFLDDAREEASTDSMTSVGNRRAFEAALRAHAGDSMNDGSDLAFLIIDVDNFKRVNDRWGHAAGDDVLRMVAKTLTRIVRGQDFVARFGGEEFAIILPDTDRQGALATAEKLRAAIEQQALHPDGASPLRVTVSAGASCYDHGENLAAWLERADSALYVCKNGGRNQVAFGEIKPRGSNVVPIAPRLHGSPVA